MNNFPMYPMNQMNQMNQMNLNNQINTNINNSQIESALEEEKLDKNNVEEIIEVKKDESNKKPIKAKEDDIPASKDNLKIDEHKEKVIYQNNRKDSNDKTSFAHSIIFEGEDIDITRKKVYECLEQTGTNFIIFKKKNKTKRLILFEEKFLYILKEITGTNNSNINIRRISRRYDLSKLCNIELSNSDDEFKFSLHFLKNDYFDREVKVLFFNQEEGRLFYQKLADTIEEIESSFFDDLFEYEDDDDDEEKEEEDEEKVDKEKSDIDIDMSAKHFNNMINVQNNDLDLISSTRKKII